MKKKFDRVYQFKIILKGIKPPIWRRIQVPETYNFWDFHVAIQDAMGWWDYHLHEFKMFHPITQMETEIGIPSKDDELFDIEIIPEHKQKIAKWFSFKNKIADYIYDFGDSWQHRIELEDILSRDKNINYPVCIAGKRACPPEDCGGVGGYHEFLRIIENPKHEEYKEMLEWVGGEFDPEYFNADDVKFEDPDERWKIAFG